VFDWKVIFRLPRAGYVAHLPMEVDAHGTIQHPYCHVPPGAGNAYIAHFKYLCSYDSDSPNQECPEHSAHLDDDWL
jgi:hypothetical protein